MTVLVLPINRLPAQDSQASLGQGENVRLQMPLGLAVGEDGTIYVSERNGHRVIGLNPDSGRVTVIAGTGNPGMSAENLLATESLLSSPDSIDVDRDGNVFIADRGNNRICVVSARNGLLRTLAGKSHSDSSRQSSEYEFKAPFFVDHAGQGELLVADTNHHQICIVDIESGEVDKIAGTGSRGFSGDGGSAQKAELSRPHVALRASNGDTIIGDSFNARIRRIDSETGMIRTIAFNGEVGVATDGAKALSAPSGFFGGIVETVEGDLLISEWVNGRIMRLDTSEGILQVVAGTIAEDAKFEDGKDPLSTKFGSLGALALDKKGRILVVDADHGRLLRIDTQEATVEMLIGDAN